MLVWDTLPTEDEFEKQSAIFNALFSESYSAVRVQDVGVFQMISPSVPVHLVLETGHHNLESVLPYVNKEPNNVKRLVLSNEVPMSTIAEWSKKLTVELEAQVFGPVLIFYSPRYLLPGNKPQDDEHTLYGRSDEDQREFRFVANQNGTLMYLDKWLFLLDQVDHLEAAGIQFGRIHLSELGSIHPELVEPFIKSIASCEKDANIDDDSSWTVKRFRDELNMPLTRGFFKANKTDRQFKRLKNAKMREQQPQARALVLETVRKKYHVLEVFKPLQVQATYRALTPDGLEMDLQFEWLQEPWGEKVETVFQRPSGQTTFLCSHVSGLSSGTLILD